MAILPLISAARSRFIRHASAETKGRFELPNHKVKSQHNRINLYAQNWRWCWHPPLASVRSRNILPGQSLDRDSDSSKLGYQDNLRHHIRRKSNWHCSKTNTMDLDLHDQTLGLLSLEAKESQKSEVHTIRYALSGRKTSRSEHSAEQELQSWYMRCQSRWWESDT